jgi:hypothetical protein
VIPENNNNNNNNGDNNNDDDDEYDDEYDDGDDDSDSGGDDNNDNNNVPSLYLFFRTSSLSTNYTTSLLSPQLYHLKIKCLSAIKKDLDVDTIAFYILDVTYSDDDHIAKNSLV